MTKLSDQNGASQRVEPINIANGNSGLIAQGEFFPLRTAIELPDCVVGADVWGRVTGLDTHDYIVKGRNGGEFVPVSELIGTQLAEAVNLACPCCKVVELSNGELMFGSRVISGVSDQIRTSQILTASSVYNQTTPKGLTSYLSEVYAFDMFTGNIDRHDNNFITVDDNGVIRFYLMDFARSLLWHNDSGIIPGPNHNTIKYGRVFRNLHGFDLDSANAMLDKIAAISRDKMIAILRSVPDDWLSGTRKEHFLHMWGGEARLEKVSRLRKGFRDGSLF